MIGTNTGTAMKRVIFGVSLIAWGLSGFFAADSLLQAFLALFVALQFIFVGVLDGWCYTDEWFQKKAIKVLFIAVGCMLIVLTVLQIINYNLLF